MASLMLYLRIKRIREVLGKRRHHLLPLFRRQRMASGQVNIGHTEIKLGLALIHVILHALPSPRDK